MSESDSKLVRVEVAGLVLEPNTGAPVVLLRDPAVERYLPIWIGLAEASSIAAALRGVPRVRPLSHDLIIEAISALGGRVEKVAVTKLEETTFYASIELVSSQGVYQLDARPSDAIGVAVRLSVPVFVAADVFDVAGVVAEVVTTDRVLDDGASVANDLSDKGNYPGSGLVELGEDDWAKILAELSPADFKYKM